MANILYYIKRLFNSGSEKTEIVDGITVLTPRLFGRTVAEDPYSKIIDLRTQDMYDIGHLPGAISIPMKDVSAFDNSIEKLDKSGKHYFLYCESGIQSHTAAIEMHRLGFDVTELKGGYKNWLRHNMPLDKDVNHFTKTSLLE